MIFGGVLLPVVIQRFRLGLGSGHAVGAGGVLGLDENVAHIYAVDHLGVGVVPIFVQLVIDGTGVAAGQEGVVAVLAVAVQVGAGVKHLPQIALTVVEACLPGIGGQGVHGFVQIGFIVRTEFIAVGSRFVTQALGLIPGVHRHVGQILVPGLGVGGLLLVKGGGKAQIGGQVAAQLVIQGIEAVPVKIDELLVGEHMVAAAGDDGVRPGDGHAHAAVIGGQQGHGLQKGLAAGLAGGVAGLLGLRLGVHHADGIMVLGMQVHIGAAPHQKGQQAQKQNGADGGTQGLAPVGAGGTDIGHGTHLFGGFSMIRAIQKRSLLTNRSMGTQTRKRPAYLLLS